MRNAPTSSRWMTTTALAVLIGLTAAQPAAAATYSASTETSIVDTLTDPQHAGGSQPASAHSSGGQTGTAAATAAQASATVTTGGIHLSSYSVSEVMQGPALIYSRAEAWGSFSDEFVLSAAGMAPGSLGRITVAFGISG